MNFKTLYRAELAAQELANASNNRALIYKPRNQDSYEVVAWNMRDFDNQNYVGECAPANWGF